MHKNPYKTFDNYILRTPIFSLNSYLDLTDGNNINDQKLKKITSLPEFKEAIYLASPNLLSTIDKWKNDLIKDDKKQQQLKISILKYIARMSSRCTPFGLFAACSIGRFSSKTEIKLKDRLEYKRSTRFDMTFLDSLCRSLSQNLEIKRKLKFHTNNSLQTLNKEYRYVSYTLENNKRLYHLEGVTKTSYLEAIIQEAMCGKTIDELILVIAIDDVTKEEAEIYIDTLIENRILISELEPTITGSNTLNNIIELLGIRLSKDNTTIQELKEYRENLKTIDESFINDTRLYKNFREKVKGFEIPINEKSLFQVDIIASTEVNVLNILVERQIKEAMVILNKMSFPYELERMARFKQRFKKRFGEEEVSLCFALDTEVGLGYDVKKNDFNPMLDDLILTDKKKRYKSLIWADVDELLLRKVILVLKDNTKIIELNNDDFKDYNLKWTDLPDTIYTLVEVINSENKTQIFCQGVGGSSAANLIARFSDLDKSIFDYVDEIISVEQQMNSDKIIAEIVHLPQARTGNITYRSVQREYEIPYLGKSSLPKERKIDVNDIMVSIKGNDIILRSKKLNRQILPRLTNAHASSSQSLPIYRFLCDMQTQNKREGIGFAWHDLFNNFSFLPRVMYKDIIFSKAKWRINQQEIAHLYDYMNEDLRDLFLKWCYDLELPQYVQLIEDDRTLLINTHNLDCMDMLLHIVKNKTYFVLEEFLLETDETVTKNGSSFCNQFVISFFNEKKLKTRTVNGN